MRTTILSLLLLLAIADACLAQAPTGRVGEIVPRDVREMYDRGLQYLATTQTENGDWTNKGRVSPVWG
jgi:hypothetical protein